MAEAMQIKDVDALFTSDTEKTFQYDNDLPSLPVPTLEHTLNRYLDSVRPHLTPDEFRQTEFIAQQFASGVGKELHQQLQARAKTERNWLAQWWSDYAYMDFREPIGPLLNFAGPAPYCKHYLAPKEGAQIGHAAIAMHYSLKFWDIVRNERLKPDRDSKGERFSMDQYHLGYSTCRIPAVQRDSIKSYFKTVSEGGGPTHMVVLCRGRIFTMSVLDKEGMVLTPPSLRQQFQYIRDICDKEPPGPGLGTLTGHKRTDWAQIRSRLLAIHPQNHQNLEVIQSSLATAILDDDSPSNETELFQLALAGDPTNRWFDKSVSLLFFKNGMVASNCDHSPVDAMILVSSTYYVDLSILKCKGKWQGDPKVQEIETPQELKFYLDEVVHRGIADARQVYLKYANDLECSVMNFDKYGKTFLRQHKLHPDTHVQMALQYTYYKIHNKPAPTYQTGTTRKFYRARTETVRSCTSEAVDFAKSMRDVSATNATKFSLYKQAADKHNKLMSEATNNQGCDRHLLGLQILAIEGGYSMPLIYTDPAYKKSGGGGNFVLSTSHVGYTSVYGGVLPMCHNGYGCFYRIESKLIAVFVSAWKSHSETDSRKFTSTLEESLQEMATMILEQSNANARL